jgi:hypothetical protein
MKNQVFDDFFYFFSKIVIFFPLVLIVIGLILKFNQKQEYSSFNQNLSPTKIFFSPTPKISKVTIDLKGPWQCLLKNDEAIFAGYIKDRKIKIEIKNNKGKSYFLIENDCLYQWNEGQFSGDKSCGLGPYLNFIESILKNNYQTFFNLFLKQFKEFSQENFSLENICEKENVEESIFLVPAKVLFRNKSLNL